MECAGNGRAKLEPRPVSQPWLQEAVGTGSWRGVPLRVLLEEAGVDERAVEVVFTGLDHGIEGEVEQDYARSLPLDGRDARRGAARLRAERRAAAAAARLPAPARRPGLVRDDEREVAGADRRSSTGRSRATSR